MVTLIEILKKSAEFLAAKGVESPRLNAELLIGHALGLKRMELYLQFERPLPEAELERIRPLLRRRAGREPLQYILGEAQFFSLRLQVDRRALIPRPESEELVEHIQLLAEETPPARILELGVGSGAIAFALADRFSGSEIHAVDLSEDALELARENAAALGLKDRVRLYRSRWYDAVPADQPFGLIVANPPYLTQEEWESAAPEVRVFEPREALVAADGGRADLETIIAGAPRFLIPGGLLALETGIAQHDELLRKAREAGLSRAESRQDLSGRDRFVFAWK